MNAPNGHVGCRSCGAKDLRQFLDLGISPLADRFLSEQQLAESEPKFPLQVAYCPQCSLMQILETVPPEVLFCDKYPYYSSVSDALLKHSRENVLDVIRRRHWTSDSLVVELASNDGYLLKNYVEQGIPVLGIDPAPGPARAAQRIGVPTLNAFFTVELAKNLRAERKRADVVHGNNVLAHVADTNGFVAGIKEIMKDDGMAVIEVPYAKDLIDHVEFDTIYHEHLCYFSVTALDRLFRRHGLYLNDVRHLSIHGGSLRLFVEPRENVELAVRELLELEQREGVDRFEYYGDFSRRVERVKEQLLALLRELKLKGGRIAAYGAAAKGTTLINYVGLGIELIDFVVDRNVHKQGHFMPGRHIPILSPGQLVTRMPDYVLLLSWNFVDEIMAQQQEYLRRGGRFIVPVPEPRIL